MKLLGIRELLYQRKNLRQVMHVTLDPAGPGVVRIHMVPPRRFLDQNIPGVLIINGQDILPISFSWSVLLAEFIMQLQTCEDREIPSEELAAIIGRTVDGVRKVYPRTAAATITDDLQTIVGALTDIAAGRTPVTEIGLLSLGDYAPYMTAPHRMDLMISSMDKDGSWNCNQQCLHCYAAGQPRAQTRELTTDEWLTIITKSRQASIPQLTFTGGEPTLRADLVELVAAASWFITRLNTNGVLLTPELCSQLYQASLDSVQITLYSADSAKHNILVGADNWDLTVAGIRNALTAGLNVSINTPLCSLNSDYVETLRFLKGLGVRYVSCSGLIPAGNAVGQLSVGTRLTDEQLETALRDAMTFARDNDLDIAFTSPGWLPGDTLRVIGLTSVPTCGACLSNMAVTPDGHVVPCQSWLSGAVLGNMLTDPWQRIWQNRACHEIRQTSAKMEALCQLNDKTISGGAER